MELLIFIVVLFLIGLSILTCCFYGWAACSIVGCKGKDKYDYFFIGLIGHVIGVLGVEYFNIDSVLAYLSGGAIGVLALTLVVFLLEGKPDETDTKNGNENKTLDTSVELKAEIKNEGDAIKMSKISYGDLIRIPVWALYSLIVATVLMSFVMLVNIWFPETFDKEVIVKILLSYGVFLISALVISNLTDKIKTMKQYESEK